MRITQKIIWDFDGNVIEHEFYDYNGPIEYCGGGPSAGEESVAAQQSALFTTMASQASQVFGASSNVFNQLMSTFSPLVAAGPNQYGFSTAQDQALRSQAITDTGTAVKNAQQASAEQAAAMGGGNVAIPSGARDAMAARINTAGALQTSNQLLGITNAGYQQGRNNWAAAVNGELNAPSVFSPATQAGSAAGNIGNSAFGMQDTMQKERNSGGIMGALGGILGKVAGAAIPGVGGAIGSAIGGAFGGGGGNGGGGGGTTDNMYYDDSGNMI